MPKLRLLRKAFLLKLAIVIGVFLGLSFPYTMGILTQGQIDNMVTQELPGLFNQSTAAYKQRVRSSTQIVSYKRGLFTSAAVIELKLTHNSANNGQDKSLLNVDDSIRALIRLNISHGPVMWVKQDDGRKKLLFGRAYVVGSVVPQTDHQAILDKLFADQSQKPQLLTRIKIGYTGHSSVEMNFTPFSYLAPKNAGTFTFKGLVAAFDVDRNFENTAGNAVLKGLDVTTPQMSMQIAKMKMSFFQTIKDDSTLYSENNITVPSFVVLANSGPSFSVTDIVAGTKNTMVQGIADITMTADVAKIIIDDVTYGPGHYESSINNLDVNTLLKMREKLTQVQYKGSTRLQRRDDVMSAFALWPSLLLKKPEFVLRSFEFAVPDGLVKIDGRVGFDKDTDAANLRGFNILTNLKAYAHFEVPSQFAQKLLANNYEQKYRHQQAVHMLQDVKAQKETSATPYIRLKDDQIIFLANQNALRHIDQWVKKGLLTLRNNIYMMDIKVKKGAMFINGQPLLPQSQVQLGDD